LASKRLSGVHEGIRVLTRRSVYSPKLKPLRYNPRVLTRLQIRSFKRFGDISIELGNPVVFIGPNNSGKTTALQALALWDLGVKRWLEKRGGGPAPEQRPGVTLNRRDLLTVPVPSTKLLWRDLHVRDVRRENDKPRTSNVLVKILVEGVSSGTSWRCGMEFDYANEESFYCRPLRTGEEAEGKIERMPVPEEAGRIDVAFLPPMSGLAANETRLDPGAIQVRLGEGKTAEVLRNLCHQTLQEKGPDAWQEVVERIQAMFGVAVEEPRYVPERGEITMSYLEHGTRLDLSAAGRGLQQTLLLLAYLQVNPGSVILIDEPDAHLEILRQREIYRLLSESAQAAGSQVILASHSEVVLNEAADRDVVVAFVGEPHRIDDRGTQVLKALKELGFEQYFLAEQRGWVLYLEGATDLVILQAFARSLEHPAARALDRPFVHYIENQPQKGRDHFHGLREGKGDLVGLLVTDRLERELQDTDALREWMWRRREIENYLCQPATLLRFAEAGGADWAAGPLFAEAEKERCRSAMERSIRDLVPPVAMEDPEDAWWRDVKASDELLDRLFERYYARLELPNLMRKSNYHQLAPFVAREDIGSEVTELLDLLLEVAGRARPVGEEPG